MKKLTCIIVFISLASLPVKAQEEMSFASYFKELQLKNFSNITNVLIKQELAKNGINKSLLELEKEEIYPLIKKAYESFVKDINYTKHEDGRTGIEITFNDESVVSFFLTEEDSAHPTRDRYLSKHLGQQSSIKTYEGEERAKAQAQILVGVIGPLPISGIVVVHNPNN
jgi:hypothetical protein